MLHHSGPGGKGPGDFVSVLLMRCDAMAKATDRDSLPARSPAPLQSEASMSLAGMVSPLAPPDLRGGGGTGAQGGAAHSVGTSGAARTPSTRDKLRREDSLFPGGGAGDGEDRDNNVGAVPLLWESLGGENSLLAVALSIVMSNLTPCTTASAVDDDGTPSSPVGGGGGSVMLAHRVRSALRVCVFVCLSFFVSVCESVCVSCMHACRAGFQRLTEKPLPLAWCSSY